jgi:CheY-like chemotaxis protein
MRLGDHDPAVDAPRAPQTLRSVSVLVIDDDADTHELFGVILRNAGYSVEAASNGREALKLLEEIQPALILLDIEMPVMNGSLFRETQRRDPRLVRIPTIVMTGSREEPQLDPGVQDVLRKPFRSKQLVDAIGRYCAPGV